MASICAITVALGLNGERMPPSVINASFFVDATFVNTNAFTRAARTFAARMGTITSVNSAFPVTSWNRRLKSPSSKERGTMTFSQLASASFVNTHAARWSVSTKTAPKSSGSASSATRSFRAAKSQPSPRRAHRGICVSSGGSV